MDEQDVCMLVLLRIVCLNLKKGVVVRCLMQYEVVTSVWLFVYLNLKVILMWLQYNNYYEAVTHPSMFFKYTINNGGGDSAYVECMYGMAPCCP